MAEKAEREQGHRHHRRVQIARHPDRYTGYHDRIFKLGRLVHRTILEPSSTNRAHDSALHENDSLQEPAPDTVAGIELDEESVVIAFRRITDPEGFNKAYTDHPANLDRHEPS
jgi:hypothetical protein